MMARFWRAAKRPVAAWDRLHAPAPVRPIVVIESDDWGRAGLPSLRSMEQLKAAGVPIGESPWDFYGLESEDDVVRLGDMLADIRDGDGKPTCITANFIMANADLERMQRENFQEFRWIAIDRGFPEPGNESVFPAYRRNIDRNLFYPGLHGFTHFNAATMLKLLAETSSRGDRMRQLARHGVPYLASLTPECNFALVERRGAAERFLPDADQESWIEAGIGLFDRAFGRTPVTTCAPGYRANDTTIRLWRRHGIEAVQTNGRRGVLASAGMIVLERNVAVEPSLAPGFSVENAIGVARRAVERGRPIIICSHSINYISRFLGGAEEGRRQLGELLRGLLQAFPDLRFASDADIVAAWKANDPGWVRPPTAREIAARIRFSIGGDAGTDKLPLDEEDAPLPPSAGAIVDPTADATFNPNAAAYAPITSRLGVASLYVLLGNAFTLIVGLPLQIYVSRVLGPDGVGIYGLLEAAMATAAGLLGLGVGETVVRFLPAHLERREYGNALGLLRFGASVLFAVGAAAYAILLLSLPWIGRFWPAILPYRGEIAAMGLMIPFGLVLYFLQQSLRGFQEIRQIILGSSVMQLTVKAALTVGAFAIGLRLDGYVLAVVSATACGLLWLLYELRRKVFSLPSATASSVALPQWYRFALMSYSGALIGAASSGLDRFLLGAFVSSGAVGVLLVARQLQNLPERFNQMLLMVGAPLLSAAHSRRNLKETQHIFCLITDWSVRCSLPLVLFLLFFARPVLALYGPGFADLGALPLQILVGAEFLGLLCGPNGNVAMMSGLERQATVFWTATAALSAVMLLVLIPQFGLVGAAFAVAFGILFTNFGTAMLICKKLHLHWWDNRYSAWLPQAGANLLVILTVSLLPLQLGAGQLFAVLVAMYVSAVVAGVAFGLHEDERELLRHIRIRLTGRKASARTDHGS
jgi:O-antigen/teichoic acid export membrane protein